MIVASKNIIGVGLEMKIESHEKRGFSTRGQIFQDCGLCRKEAIFNVSKIISIPHNKRSSLQKSRRAV